ITDPRIEQTDDQALGRPRVIYIEDKRAQKAGVFHFLSGLLQSLLALFNDATTRRNRPPNKPSIPDPRIEQTDDQALGRPRVIYIGDKRAQKAGVFLFLPGLLQSLLTLFNNVTTRRD